MLQKLQYHTVESETLGVLRQLLQLDCLSNARLVGGTALALQLGHRSSMDLDIFGQINIKEIIASNFLGQIGTIKLLRSSPSIFSLLINGIKVDLVNYNYPWLEEAVIIDDIRLAGYKDIGAMKLAAITGRGSRKDFIDLFFLLHKYKLDDLMDNYKEKYRDGSEFLVLKSLTYFEDADLELAPKMYKDAEWNKIKTSIIKYVNKYNSQI